MSLQRFQLHAGTVAVLSAGTADEGVAEECRLIADFMGCYTFRLPDVSVDGLHRVLHNLPGLPQPCLYKFLQSVKHTSATLEVNPSNACQYFAPLPVKRLCKLSNEGGIVMQHVLS